MSNPGEIGQGNTGLEHGIEPKLQMTNVYAKLDNPIRLELVKRRQNEDWEEWSDGKERQ